LVIAGLLNEWPELGVHSGLSTRFDKKGAATRGKL
jgi:hypothetical protein